MVNANEGGQIILHNQDTKLQRMRAASPNSKDRVRQNTTEYTRDFLAPRYVYGASMTSSCSFYSKHAVLIHGAKNAGSDKSKVFSAWDVLLPPGIEIAISTILCLR
jgi:hypothetical protein